MRLWIRRCLALGHFAWGLLLLFCAAWFTVSVFRVLPYMSTGALLTNLLGTDLLVTMQALPLAAIGAWMLILGRWLWFGHRRLRTALLWTHGVLLVLGSLAVAIGIHAVGAAERSAGRGGGLLSPVAVIPLLFGVPVVVLALCSIAIALTVIPRHPSASL